MSVQDRQNGRECIQCGGIVCLLNPSGRPSRCGSCIALQDDAGEVLHSDLIRCPHCRHTQFAEGHLYSDGEHEVYCGECDQVFTVSTSVSYTFTSPPVAALKGE
jgi:hypothetical protein